MNRSLVSLAALAGLLSMATVATAAPHTQDDAKALVMKAVDTVRNDGREKALAEFSDPKGEFVDGDLYLFVMDINDPQLKMLAHGTNKALIGKPQIAVKDADGRAFNEDGLRLAQSPGEGWIEYKWSNPATHKIAAKVTFVKKAGDLLIGSGIYK